MGLTLLAQECKIGSTTYYLANVKANTLIQNVGYASEMENWSDMTIDERMQREIKGDRVAEEIVPYIVNDSDWFFGALIVDIYKGWEKVKFQGIKDVVEVKFDAYDNTLDNAGFLTLPDDKSLIALDGQHRLAALNMAIRGKNGIPGSVQLSDAVRETLVPHPEIGKAGDVDTAIITLKMENGALAVIDNSRQAVYGYDQRAEVFGSKGMVAIKNDSDSTAVISNEDGVTGEKPQFFFLERYMDAYGKEMVQFIDAIENDTETPLGVEDGLKPVLMGLAAKKSVEEGRPVKISEIEF